MENNYHNRPKYRKKMIAGRSAVIVTASLYHSNLHDL